MADVDDKQSLMAVENTDLVCNEVDLTTPGSGTTDASVETTNLANEPVDVIVSPTVDGSTEAADQSSRRRSSNDCQPNGDNVNTAKDDVQLRKRTTGRCEPVACAVDETRVKRRRVQHNYRRLSSAGYVDDYDGRERFSGKQTTSSPGNSSSSVKSKSVSSLGVSKLRQPALKTTRSRSETGTNVIRGQSEIRHQKIFGRGSSERTSRHFLVKFVMWKITLLFADNPICRSIDDSRTTQFADNTVRRLASSRSRHFMEMPICGHVHDSRKDVSRTSGTICRQTVRSRR